MCNPKACISPQHRRSWLVWLVPRNKRASGISVGTTGLFSVLLSNKVHVESVRVSTETYNMLHELSHPIDDREVS